MSLVLRQDKMVAVDSNERNQAVQQAKIKLQASNTVAFVSHEQLTQERSSLWLSRYHGHHHSRGCFAFACISSYQRLDKGQ
jgi:hypothetical protein